MYLYVKLADKLKSFQKIVKRSLGTNILCILNHKKTSKGFNKKRRCWRNNLY